MRGLVFSLLLVANVLLPSEAAVLGPQINCEFSPAGTSQWQNLRSDSLHQAKKNIAGTAATQNVIVDTPDGKTDGVVAKHAGTTTTSKLAMYISSAGLGIVIVAGIVFAVFVTRTAKPLDTSVPIAKKSAIAKQRESPAASSVPAEQSTAQSAGA